MATRLQALALWHSRLQGSAEGFLTCGWTALTSLSLTGSRMEHDVLLPALQLPALENVSIDDFGHRGGMLQLEQLTGSCPQVSRLRLQLEGNVAPASEGRGQRSGLHKLGRLAELHIANCSHRGIQDWDLPASLTRLTVEGCCGFGGVLRLDLFWVVHGAAACISRGAQLRTLVCFNTEAFLQSVEFGTDVDEQGRQLGGQLSGLQELTVWGCGEGVLSTVSALASSAPSLTRLECGLLRGQRVMELPPIRSATLESITVVCYPSYVVDHPMTLTLLHGCTRLQEVLVRFQTVPIEGTAVRIRCHCSRRRCIVPFNPHTGQAKELPLVDVVGVHFLPMHPHGQGTRIYTIMYAYHATEFQRPMWGHVVMPGSM